MTPYYDKGGITIYCGDCLEVMPTLAKVGLVITSPPYNLGISSGGGLAGATKSGKWKNACLARGYISYGDDLPSEEYVEWQRAFLLRCWQLISPDGAIYYNHKPRVQDGILQTPLDLNPDLPLRQIIIWKRAGGINFATTHYLPTHEWIVCFAKSGFRLKSKGASGVGDVWEFPQESNNIHPAPFPIELPSRIIETTGANLVCDPFSGSGSTLVAAKSFGIKAIGIEISEDYCQIAVERLRQPSFFSIPNQQPKAPTYQQSPLIGDVV